MARVSEKRFRELWSAVADRLAQQWSNQTWTDAGLVRATCAFLRLNRVTVGDDHKVTPELIKQKVLANSHLIDINDYLERRDG